MTNALTDLRIQLDAALTGADLHSFPIVPERVVPPFVSPGPGDPYVQTEGANFGCVLVRHEVTIAAGAGVNDKTAEDVDSILLAVIAAIPDEFGIESSAVGRVEVNGQRYLGAILQLITEIELPEAT